MEGEEIKFGEQSNSSIRESDSQSELTEDLDDEEQSFDSERKSKLTIKVNPDASKHSITFIAKFIEKSLALGQKIEIKVDDYGKGSKENIDQLRKDLIEDEEIDIFSEVDETEEKDDEDEVASNADSSDLLTRSNLITRSVDFAKTSDLITMESMPIISKRIKGAAIRDDVLISYSKQGYILKGEKSENLDRVEQSILDIYHEIHPVKLYKGIDPNKIDVISLCSRRILPDISRRLGLKFIYSLDSKLYYRTYQRIAGKVKGLSEKLTPEKLKNTALRFVLIQKNAESNPQIRDQFIGEFYDSCVPRSVLLKITDAEPISHKDKLQIFKMARKEMFHAIIEAVQESQDEKPILIQRIMLITFVKDDNLAKKVLFKGEKIKNDIFKMLYPLYYYNFRSMTEMHMYRALLEPDLQTEAKLSKITLKIVQTDRNKAQADRKHANDRFKKARISEFSLQISGKKNKDKTAAFYKSLCSIIKGIHQKYLPIKLNGNFANQMIKILSKSQNNTFFAPYISEAADLYPGTFSEQSLQYPQKKSFKEGKKPFKEKKEPLKGKKKPFEEEQKPFKEEKEPVKGEKKPFKEGKKPFNQGKKPFKEEKGHNPQFPELVMCVYSKDQQSLENLEVFWNNTFNQIVSKQVQVPNIELPDLFANFNMNLLDFKKDYKVAVDEYMNQGDQQRKITIVGEEQSVADAIDFLKSLTQTMNPKREVINTGNNLLLKAVKPELGKLIDKDVKITIEWAKNNFQLYGPANKVQKAKESLEACIEKKRSLLKREIQTGLASSHLKFFQERKRNLIFKLQNENEVNLQFDRVQNIEMVYRIDHSQTGRSIILCKGKITKLQCDAIVNSTNLDFSEGNIYQGVSRDILTKAGGSYLEESKNQKTLSAGEVLTTNAGNLTNCKAVINVCPPLYKSDKDLPEAIEVIRIGISKVIIETMKNGYLSLAIPFFSAGNYGIPPKEVITTIIDELSQLLFIKNSPKLVLKEVYLCEIDQNKIEIAQNKLESLLKKAETQINTPGKVYQWRWADDGDVWKDYDINVNRQIQEAFQQSAQSVKITFPASRDEGSHILDLTKQTITRKSTRTVSSLKRKPDGWYENNEKLSDGISELIDLKQKQGLQLFELFLNEYLINFAQLTQVNLKTNYQRKIKREESDKILPKIQSQLIEGLKGKSLTTSKPTSYTGSIIYEGFSIEKIALVKKKINEELENQKVSIKVTVPDHIGAENLENLYKEIQKLEIVISGDLAPGKTLTLMGLSYQLTKIEDFLKVIKSAQIVTEDTKLPSHWAPMGDNIVLTVELKTHEQEWIDVSKRFSLTMGSIKIKSIKRIQHAKFWRDYNREKKDLSELYKKAGVSVNVKEELLWHGTRTTHPRVIYEDNEESFHLVYANDGMWGRGLYFAVNASYSANYAHPTPQQTKLFMLARVMVGEFIQLPSNSSLRRPPPREKTLHPINYDSVKGNTGGSDIYILYQMRRAYPEYLIEYL